MFKKRKSAVLEMRAEIAAKQMRYFRLFSQTALFYQLIPSAKRAGFALIEHDDLEKEAAFHWAASGDDIDFVFHVSFNNADQVAVLADSCRDIYGLIMISHSHLPNISVEIKSELAKHEFGANAVRFRKILLTFPDFDGGTEDFNATLS
jgi:hypothetical protein